MAPIRVLLADDSVVVRKLLSGILSENPNLEVVGTAPDGEILLQKVELTDPQVVILDVEMPVLDGLGTLKRLRETCPSLPVLMFSNLTRKGAESTIDALLAGAQDYVPKPSSSRSLEESSRYVNEHLVPKILQWGRAGTRVQEGSFHFRGKPGMAARPVTAVLIGASTGGPNALAEVLTSLPLDFGVPIAIAQHMPPVFTEVLASRLGAKSGWNVLEAREGQPFNPGRVYLAAGDRHLGFRLEDDAVTLRVFDAAPVHSCRPSVDVLFEEGVSIFGAGTLAVVLTGMGYDGVHGSGLVREAGGCVLAQDETSSVVWGMPGGVVQAGFADAVVPLGDISAEIRRRWVSGLSRKVAP